MVSKLKTKSVGITSSTTVEELRKIEEALDSLKNKSSSSLDELLKLISNYESKMKAQNPYKELIDQQKQEQEQMTVSLDYYEDAMQKRLSIDRWYRQEKEKLQKNQSNMSASEIMTADKSLNELYSQRYAQAEEEVWMERGEKVAEVFQNNFDDILKNYRNFGDELESMAKEITSVLVREAASAGFQALFNTNKLKSWVSGLSSLSTQGGFKGFGASFLKGIGKAFGVFHSGGIVPVGANAEIPGTNEQLALLKGGERILSPAENTSYNSNGSQSGSSPVVLNNFNIKAWDSKDVKQYLLENKNLLNQITFDGIKNNNCQLRNMVRGA